MAEQGSRQAGVEVNHMRTCDRDVSFLESSKSISKPDTSHVFDVFVGEPYKSI